MRSVDDFGDVDTKRVSEALGIQYLSPAPQTPKWPANGRLYGPYLRPIVALGVGRHVAPELPVALPTTDRCVFAAFVVHPATSVTRFAPELVSALVPSSSPTQAVLEVNGVPLRATLSTERFNFANVLGTDFLSAARAELALDYDLNALVIRS